MATDRAITHSDASVLERHHLHAFFATLRRGSMDFLAPLLREDRVLVRKMVIDAVLATDLSRHLEFLSRMRTLAAAGGAMRHKVYAPDERGADDRAWLSL